jgi:hypothetical protein
VRRRDDLDLAPFPALEAQRLGDRLLGAETGGEVLARARTGRRVSALPVGEDPLLETRAPRQRLLQSLDLQQVEAAAAGAAPAGCAPGAVTRR